MKHPRVMKDNDGRTYHIRSDGIMEPATADILVEKREDGLVVKGSVPPGKNGYERLTNLEKQHDLPEGSLTSAAEDKEEYTDLIVSSEISNGAYPVLMAVRAATFLFLNGHFGWKPLSFRHELETWGPSEEPFFGKTYFHQHRWLVDAHPPLANVIASTVLNGKRSVYVVIFGGIGGCSIIDDWIGPDEDYLYWDDPATGRSLEEVGHFFEPLCEWWEATYDCNSYDEEVGMSVGQAKSVVPYCRERAHDREVERIVRKNLGPPDGRVLTQADVERVIEDGFGPYITHLIGGRVP